MFRVRNGDKEHVSWKGEQNGNKDAEGGKSYMEYKENSRSEIKCVDKQEAVNWKLIKLEAEWDDRR